MIEEIKHKEELYQKIDEWYELGIALFTVFGQSKDVFDGYLSVRNAMISRLNEQ